MASEKAARDSASSYSANGACAFSIKEISLHESKATCNGCLMLMGSTPIQSSTNLEILDPAEIARMQKQERRKTPSRLPLIGLSAVGSLAALVAVAYFTPYLDTYLKQAGLFGQKPVANAKPLQQQKPVTTMSTTGDVLSTKVTTDPLPVAKLPTVIGPNFDSSKVSIANAPSREYTAFSRWTYKPQLNGVEELDQTAPGWKTEYFLKDRPLGMAIEDGAVVFKSDSRDFDALKRGEKYNVELTVKGFWKSPEGIRKDLFSVTRSFTLATQFGYEVGPEADLGMSTEARNLDFISFDINGDGLKDLIVMEGSLGRGSLRAVLSGPEGTRQTLSIAEGARFAGACPVTIGGKEGAALAATNWQTGELVIFTNRSGTFEKRDTLRCAPGLMGVTAMNTPDGKIMIATLSNVAGSLYVATYDPKTGFGVPVVVPMLGGGGNGRVINWTSPELGPGFLVVTPLAEDPLRFVPVTGDDWVKGTPVTISSPLAQRKASSHPCAV